jgi:hypothetical protein
MNTGDGGHHVVRRLATQGMEEVEGMSRGLEIRKGRVAEILVECAG